MPKSTALRATSARRDRTECAVQALAGTSPGLSAGLRLLVATLASSCDAGRTVQSIPTPLSPRTRPEPRENRSKCFRRPNLRQSGRPRRCCSTTHGGSWTAGLLPFFGDDDFPVSFPLAPSTGYARSLSGRFRGG